MRISFGIVMLPFSSIGCVSRRGLNWLPRRRLGHSCFAISCSTFVTDSFAHRVPSNLVRLCSLVQPPTPSTSSLQRRRIGRVVVFRAHCLFSVRHCSANDSGTGVGVQTAHTSLERLEVLIQELQRSNDELRKENRQYHLENLEKSAVARDKLFECLSKEDRRLWQPETAERLHEKIVKLEARVAEPITRVEQLLENRVGGLLDKLTIRGRRVVDKRTLLVLLVLSILAYIGRHIIYGMVADESAHLGKAVMEKNTENIVRTLDAIAHDPETLNALIQLLCNLIDDPTTQNKLLQLLRDLFGAESTRKALLDLLVWVFRDEYLCNLTGEFLLNSLNTDTTREMLNRQVAALASKTVLDRQVQIDTGTFANEALKDGFFPSWMRPKPASER